MRITEGGIETAEGERPFDIVIWATGFDFGTGALSDGDPGPARSWRSPTTGLTARPHFSACRPPISPTSSFPAGPRCSRQQPAVQRRPGRLRHRDACLLRDHGYDVIEVTLEAEERWCEMIERNGHSLVHRNELLLRHQRPRKTSQVPPELGRTAEALQGDRARVPIPTTRPSDCHERPTWPTPSRRGRSTYRFRRWPPASTGNPPRRAAATEGR